MPQVESYCINVGKPRPNDIEVGQVLKGSGQTAIDGKKEYVNNYVGDKILPNRSTCFGKRVAKDTDGKIIKGKPSLDVTDKEYRGDILFLKEGDTEAELIYTRYLKGYNSLDVLYQNIRLNYKETQETEEGSEASYIMLAMGENEWSGKDLEANRMLVEHLKHHYLNGNYEGRPSTSIPQFWEKTSEQKEAILDKQLDAKWEAGAIVREAGTTTARLKVLASILNGVVADNVDDDQLYSHLKFIAETKADEVLKAVEKYKRHVSDTIAVFDSFTDVIDFTVDGTIVALTTIKGVMTAKDMIADSLEAKAGKQLQYLYDNMFDEYVYGVQDKLNRIAGKLKKSQS